MSSQASASTGTATSSGFPSQRSTATRLHKTMLCVQTSMSPSYSLAGYYLLVLHCPALMLPCCQQSQHAFILRIGGDAGSAETGRIDDACESPCIAILPPVSQGVEANCRKTNVR